MISVADTGDVLQVTVNSAERSWTVSVHVTESTYAPRNDTPAIASSAGSAGHILSPSLYLFVPEVPGGGL